MYCRKVGV